MAVRAATPMSVEEKLVFFTDHAGNAIAGTIAREHSSSPLYPEECELRPNTDSPVPYLNEPSSSALRILRFSATTPLEKDPVGALYLSIRKDCYEGETQRFIWIDRLDNLCKREIHQIGRSLLEKTIEESLSLGLEGRVKVMAIAGSHLFYLNCGFVPEKVEYAYSDCVAITRFLKKFFASSELMQKALKTFDPLLCEARKILASEHNKSLEEVDLRYIKDHWYWDENYPLKPSKDYTVSIQQTKEAFHSPRPHLYAGILPPMMMLLPEKSLEIWKRIIAAPIENKDERNDLFRDLHLQHLF